MAKRARDAKTDRRKRKTTERRAVERRTRKHERGSGHGPAVASCRLSVHPSGFGFAERTDGEGTIFVPAGNLGGAMDGDEVVVSHRPAERGPEGEVRSVVKRGRVRVTGVLRKDGAHATVDPDDPRVLGRAEVVGEAPEGAVGQVVVGRIVDYPDAWRDDFTIAVERVLGLPGKLATEEIKILVEHGIDPLHPDAVLEAAKHVPTRVRKSDLEGRADLRELPFMTIDPPDARDFDDAVCCEPGEHGEVRVHVAVADVSHYVRERDVFDREALERCFSVYLPDRAVPMLPHELSAGICSLVPDRERLAMVVSFTVDPGGRVDDVDVRAAVIRSRMRLTYEQAAGELAGREKLPGEIRQRIVELRQVADRLHRTRVRRGAIELSLTEIKILLDQDDPERIRGVVPSRGSPEMALAYNLIEELMVAANEAIGRIAVRHRLPIVFRVHDRPDPERVERFAGVAGLLGVEVDPEGLDTPKGMQSFLKHVHDHPRRTVLHGLLLRALAQAEYSTHNVGHFALASPAYVHFTSPIRRYPDLVAHRVMKAFLRRVGGPAGPEPVPKMPALKDTTAEAARVSEREREVISAERDTKALFSAAYMRDRIGDRFDGTVTGAVAGGVFVGLDDPPVDGMIRRAVVERDTREPYAVDDLGARMVGQKSGRAISIGDRVVVELVDASISRRQIDLSLIGKLTT